MPEKTRTAIWSPAAARLLPVLAGLLAFGIYLLSLCPTVGPGDSGELVLVLHHLGIAHPPGYALFSWLGRLLQLVPGAEPALLANLFSALCAAAAVTLLCLAARAMGLSVAGAAVSALILGFSLTFWQNAVCCEVYPLTVLLLAAVLLAVCNSDRDRPPPLLCAAFLFGLAVGHQPSAILWVPALALVLASRPARPSLSRLALPLLALFLLGLTPALGTLLRARAGASINWGDPSSVSRLVRHLAGSQYRGLTLGTTGTEFTRRLAGLPGSWLRELGIPAVLLAAGGLFGLHGKGRLLIGLLLLLATGLFGLALRVPDFTPQLLPSLVALCLLAGLGLDRIVRALGPYGRIAAWVLVPFSVGFVLLMNLGPGMENRTRLVGDLGRNLAVSLPGGTFIHSGDLAGNALAYELHRADGDNPPLQVSAERLFSRTYWERLSQDVELPLHDEALREAGRGTREQRLQRLLALLVRRLQREGPVYLAADMMRPALFDGPLAAEWGVVPVGIVNRLVPLDSQPSRGSAVRTNDNLWNTYRLGDVARSYRRPGFVEAQLTYASARNNFGMYCLGRGWYEEAARSLDAALALPASEEFRDAVRRNRSRVPDH